MDGTVTRKKKTAPNIAFAQAWLDVVTSAFVLYFTFVFM